MRQLLIPLALCGFFASESSAAILRVPADYPTIRRAVVAATHGDLILVSPGVYNESVDFSGKAITIRSTAGPNVTTIDAGFTDRGVIFVNGEGASSVLEGFTVRHGLNGSAGAGVYFSGASPTIRGNIIENNTSLLHGGGVGGTGSAIIEGNVIRDNVAGSFFGTGGGIGILGGSPVIRDNQIYDNMTVGEGGGIGCENATPTIVNNMIYRNLGNTGAMSGVGGGLYLLSSNAVVTNNTIVDNTSVSSGGGLVSYFSPGAWIANNILWNNTAPADPQIAILGGAPTIVYCDVEGGYAGVGNIDADPLFVDPLADDYHLGAGSPCLNAGDDAAPGLPSHDFEGDSRIVHGAVDIGADEYTGCFVEMTPFGVGLAGSGGFIPSLDGSGSSCDAGGRFLHIRQGLGAATGFLWIGVNDSEIPFKGGKLYIDLALPWLLVPIQLQGPAGAPGRGFLDLPGSDVNGLGPLTLVLQVLLMDAGAVQGVSLTNALSLEVK